MNTNEVYRNLVKLPTNEELKQESTITKEQTDWYIWNTHPQTIEFIKRLRNQQQKAISAAEVHAINSDEKLLRAANIESLTIKKVINLTINGTYGN